MGPELLAIALAVVNVLKRRFWPLLAFLLLPLIVLALLAGNEGTFAEEAPRWQIVSLILIPVILLVAILLIPALRLAKPDSWWARKFYGQEKLTRAEERYRAAAPPVIPPPRLIYLT